MLGGRGLDRPPLLAAGSAKMGALGEGAGLQGEPLQQAVPFSLPFVSGDRQDLSKS